MKTRVAASYKLGALGYGAGMALSALGDVGAGLALITTASIVATALFIWEGKYS